MTDHVIKPIANPDHISILFPTRGRPQFLKCLFDSLEETTRDPGQVDVWLYEDDDDRLTADFLSSEECGSYSFRVHTAGGRPRSTAGEMFNVLRERCQTNPGIYMFGGDRIAFVTKDWDEKVREVYRRLPDRLAFAFPEDPHHGQTFGAYGFISAEWTNAFGRFFSEYFHYWFDDVWLNLVAQMIQRRILLDVQIGLQGGKGVTQRMRNLLFWNGFMCSVMDEVKEEAEILRRKIFAEDSGEYHASVREGEEIALEFMEKTAPKMDFKAENEVNLSVYHLEDDHSNLSREGGRNRVFPESYFLCEVRAINHLCHKTISLLDKEDVSSALLLLETLSLTTERVRGIHYVRACCLKLLGRVDEAREAIHMELEIDPENNESLSLQACLCPCEAGQGASEDGLPAAYDDLERVKEVIRNIASRDLENLKETIHLNGQGVSLMDAGETNTALTTFANAMNLDPELALTYRNLGFLHLETGYLKTAVGYLMQALRRTPYDRELVVKIGDLCSSLGLKSESKMVYSHYLRRRPFDKYMHYKLRNV